MFFQIIFLTSPSLFFLFQITTTSIWSIIDVHANILTSKSGCWWLLKFFKDMWSACFQLQWRTCRFSHQILFMLELSLHYPQWLSYPINFIGLLPVIMGEKTHGYVKDMNADFVLHCSYHNNFLCAGFDVCWWKDKFNMKKSLNSINENLLWGNHLT